MLRPFLLIGIGGSGGKTLRVVHEDLERRLAQAGWEGDLPRAWQFLHIDVPTHADGNDPDLPRQLAARDYQGLVTQGLTYRTIDSALAGGTSRTAIGDAIAGWRPDPNKVNVPVEKGAGQYRTIGRMITVAGLDRIWTAVGKARDALTGAEVIGELQRVTLALGSEPTADPVSPVVVVISSIAGGSGAGAVIDVCDVVRALGHPWASESVGLLYAPDVFDYLPEEQRKGVRPNALASLAELLAGYWNSEGPSEATWTLLAKHGVQLGAANRMGPRYPLLVGNRNAAVSFRTQNDIYRSMGRSLASWVTSVALQDRLGAYMQANWSAAANAIPDHLPLRSSTSETPFSALGSARVGLGRDRFREYASEKLAREAVDRVLRRQEELRHQKDDRLPKKLIADTADTAFGPFLASSGLDERGETKNDILDALRGPRYEDDRRNLEIAVIRKVAGEIPQQKGASSEHVRLRIIGELQGREAKFHDEQDAARIAQARLWAGTIQRELTALAARYVAREGAPVTAELLGRLRVELLQVKEELREESHRHSRWAADLAQEVAKILQPAGADALPPNNPLIAAAVKRGVEALGWKAESHLRDLAIELIPDLVENLVEPLTTAVRNAGLSLGAEETAQVDGRPSAISLWPVDDLVPQRLLPAANEFLVDPPSGYPAVLGTLIRQSTDADSEGSARRQAVMEVILGSDDLDAHEQHVVSLQTTWVPQHPRVTAGTEPPSRAAFSVFLSSDDLHRRAGDWISRPGSRIGEYNAQGLKDYLDPDDADTPTEHNERLRRFEGQLIAALNAAGPLVSINTGVLVQVHGVQQPPISTFFTEVPLPERSPARETFTRVLQAKGMWSNTVAGALTDGTGSSIDVFSVLGTPYEPVVFDSLMQPIASEWGARSKSPAGRSEFWRWRRARPLPEFLPLSPAVRLAMIRGWFTASLLGQLDLSGPPKLFVPAETGGRGAVHPFPDPLLTADVPEQYDLLPAVLKSVMLALVEVNTRSSLEPMRPYRRLRELGESGRGGDFEEYVKVNRELAGWVLDGQLPEGAPTPREDAGTVEDDWKSRRTSVEERFARLQTQYEGLFATVERRSDAFDVPRSYELRRDVIAALEDLQRGVRHLEPADGFRSWN